VSHGLTVLAAIRRGDEERLRDVLRAIGNDIKGKTAAGGAARPHIHFVRSRTIHFARFAILRDPARAPDAARLLFSSNYDGPLEDHLADLIDITSDMDAIWGHCTEYRGVATFPDFIRAHSHEPEAFYIAFRDETIDAIRNTKTRRLGPIGRIVRGVPVVLDFLRTVRRFGFGTVFHSTNRIIASLNRYLVFRLANRITGNRLPPLKSVYSSVALDNCADWQPLTDRDEIPAAFATPPTFREDVITQNQLTLVTVVDPQHVQRVKAVMAAIDSYAKRLSPPGSLIGISTIHFVRWLLVDDDRRLIMLSDYDGSWENYIDEFAEMILSGLDAIWETSFGYPLDGARDLPAFKRFLRSHQVAAEVFFSAYPDLTVLNVAR